MQKDMLRRRVGLVFQTPAPFPFSIYKNMAYAPRYYGIRDKASLEALVKEKLEMAGLYDEVRDDLGRNALKLRRTAAKALYCQSPDRGPGSAAAGRTMFCPGC